MTSHYSPPQQPYFLPPPSAQSSFYTPSTPQQHAQPLSTAPASQTLTRRSYDSHRSHRLHSDYHRPGSRHSHYSHYSSGGGGGGSGHRNSSSSRYERERRPSFGDTIVLILDTFLNALTGRRR
jgi:hypothetical protein